MKTFTKIMAAFGGIALIGFIVLLIDIGNDPVEEVLPSPSPESISESFRDAYIEGCNEDGLYLEYCSCTYSYLDTRTSDRELMNLSLDYIETDILPEVMVEALLFCEDKL
jgi:hypothetical protein